MAAAGILSPSPGFGGTVQKAREAKDYTVVTSGEEPQGPPLSLTFREDLKIAVDGWTPWDLHVDGGGNIYVFADREWMIRKFNDRGVEIASLKLKKGQGPGEFQMVDGAFLPDGTLFIYDAPQRRLTAFNGKFEMQDIRKTDFWGLTFRMDSKSNMYFLDVRFLSGTRDRQRLVFAKHSPSGKILLEMMDYLWGMNFDRVKKKYVANLFPPQLKYAVDERDFVYYAMSDRYEIALLSPEGELSRKIVKKGLSRKVSQADIDLKMAGYSESLRARYEFTHPERMPRIAALFPVSNGSLLVITYESGPGSKNLAGDIFDEKGVFRGSAQVPAYTGWEGLLAPALARAACRGDSFYTIETDEAEENYFVKRYKMILK